VRISHVSVHFA